VQTAILSKTQDPHLDVYAVWVPFLNGSQQAANVSQRVLPDDRVTQFWDGAALTSNWFAKNIDHTTFPAWDMYYLFGPSARWGRTPGPLVSSGGTIIGQSSSLDDAIEPLLNSR
jgi:hypothetical protein